MSASVNHPRWVPYFFLSPFLLCFGVFMVYPLIQSIWLSLLQTYGPEYTKFVGLDNFRHLLGDREFHLAAWNTLIYTLGSLFIQLPVALGLAILLNGPKLRGRTFFRLVFFAPSLVGLVFAAMMFALLFGAKAGLLNEMLRRFVPGFPPEFPWLQEYVMTSLIIASLWMYAGYNMIYFLAALQNVDPALGEAAQIDGAGAWHRFVHVTLPEIRPVAGFVTLLSIIGSLQLFELPFVLLDGAGPENRGLTLVMYLYQNGFERNDLGYASAIGWVLAVFLAAIALGQRRLIRE